MENGTWKFAELTEKSDTIFINSIDLNASLENIYDGINF